MSVLSLILYILLTSQALGGALNCGVLPTSSASDSTIIDDKSLEYTICDVGNIIVFARAQDLGIQGNEKPADLNNDPSFIARVKELRGKAAQKVGMCKSWELVDEQSPMVPMVALVSKSTIPEAHIQSRLFLDNKCHTSMAGTGAICTAACSRVTGSVVAQFLSVEDLRKTTFEIQHPLGQIPVVVKIRPNPLHIVPEYDTLSFIRTSRRLLDGSLRVPDDVKDTLENNSLSIDGTHSAENYSNGTKASQERHTDGINNKPQPATTEDCLAFIDNLKYSDLTPEVKEKLRLLLIGSEREQSS